MRELLKVLTIVSLLIIGANAGGMSKKMPKNYRAIPFAKATILQKGDSKIFCAKCGMTLPMFYRTNHAAMVDGKQKQFCSIFCLVETIKSGAKVTDVQVIDNTSLKFIDANKAFYVVGSSKPATMAATVSKYAFGTHSSAIKFAKKFGGRVMNYQETLALAEADYDNDNKMKIARQAKGAKRGEIIYKKLCSPINKKFQTASEAKTYITKNNLCGGIKGKPLQMIGLYLAK